LSTIKKRESIPRAAGKGREGFDEQWIMPGRMRTGTKARLRKPEPCNKNNIDDFRPPHHAALIFQGNGSGKTIMSLVRAHRQLSISIAIPAVVVAVCALPGFAPTGLG